jgi:TATA-box binding protein (TBP) (component of TFIID and TFIIIB)
MEELKIELCDLCRYTTTNCICQSFWKDFSEKINTRYNSSLKPSSLSVSTMTVCFGLSNTRILVGDIEKYFKKTNIFSEISYKKGAKKSKDKTLNNVMFNQCELKGKIKEPGCDKISKISAMVYINGSFKVTGVKRVETIPKIVRDLEYSLKNNKALLQIESDENGKLKECRMKKVRIVMINTDFKIREELKQKNIIKQNILNEILNYETYSNNFDGPIKLSSWTQDGYPGIKTRHVHNYAENKHNMFLTRKGREKFKGEVSILTFGTGKIIITGGNEINEILGAYNFINFIIDKYRNEVLFKQK